MFMYGFFLIIFMGGQFFIGNVVFIFYFWWIEFNVINMVRWCVNMVIYDMVNDQFVWYIKFQNVINIDVCFFYCVCLWNGMWEVV